MEDVCKGCIYHRKGDECTKNHQNSAAVVIFGACGLKKKRSPNKLSSVVKIQIHDYDDLGIYRIVEDSEITLKEARELKKKARESVIVAWDKLPREARHIVYYAEMLDEKEKTWFVGIFMKGEAYTDSEFYDTYQRKGMGYVGAIHKHD